MADGAERLVRRPRGRPQKNGVISFRTTSRLRAILDAEAARLEKTLSRIAEDLIWRGLVAAAAEEKLVDVYLTENGKEKVTG